MADSEHLALLQQGVDVWNARRAKEPSVRPDLSEADLKGANLAGADLGRASLGYVNLRLADLSGANLALADLGYANLYGVNFSRADLRDTNFSDARLARARFGDAKFIGPKFGHAHFRRADLREANLSGADLSKADLIGADLRYANLREANLSGANLNEANLYGANLGGANLSEANLSVADLGNANLSGANLERANLEEASLVKTNLVGATLNGCNIYGISAWNVKLSEGTKQQGLIITPRDEPAITVDDLEVAQFVYLLLRNDKIRSVIDTITSKVVLILGRFTPERKAVLDAIRKELRNRHYVPILFDFDVPAGRDITETVSLLARMARFIIADLTEPSSIQKELEAIVPHLAVPVQPLLGEERPYSMFKDYWKYDWMLPAHRYDGLDSLLATLADKVIAPAEQKMNDLTDKRQRFEAELVKP